MPTVATTTILYESYEMYSKEGKIMCTCSKKKMEWYLKRGLAVQDPVNPKKFTLLFDSKGPGQSHEFYLTAQGNHCVCCGSTQNLTKHHLVPHCYRQHMPVALKASSSYDVLPLCTDCHAKYETYAFEKKQQLSAEVEPLCKEDTPSKEQYTATHTIQTLQAHHAKMAQTRISQLVDRVNKSLGSAYTLSDILSLPPAERPAFPKQADPLNAARLIMHKIETQQLKAFIQDWREHFLSVMQPRFMPASWTSNYFDPRHEHIFHQPQ